MDLISKSELLNKNLKEILKPLHFGKYKDEIKDILSELNQRGLFFQFELTIGEDWYCLDSSSKISIPFYLFCPHLLSMENYFAGRIEGKSKKEFKKLLRHELGHVFDHYISRIPQAKKLREQTFGHYSEPYPEKYKPNYYRNDGVDYLGECYYQSHGAEHFAEAFAFYLEQVNLKKLNKKAKEKIGIIEKLVVIYRETIKNKKHFHSKTARYKRVNLDKSCLNEMNLKLRHYYQKKRSRFRQYAYRGDCQEIQKFFKTVKQKRILQEVSVHCGLSLQQANDWLKTEFINQEVYREICELDFRSKGEIRDVLTYYFFICLQQGKDQIYL